MRLKLLPSLKMMIGVVNAATVEPRFGRGGVRSTDLLGAPFLQIREHLEDGLEL